MEAIENINHLRQYSFPTITKKNDLEVKAKHLLIKLSSILREGRFSQAGIGLLTGQASLPLFHYHYWEQTGDKCHLKLARKAVGEMNEQAANCSSLDFADGLAGYGVFSEYIATRGFIESNMNEILEDLDHLLFEQLQCSTGAVVNTFNGITGIGRYFLSRRHDSLNQQHSPVVEKIEQALDIVLEKLNSIYKTHEDINSVIDFLSDAYPFVTNKKKCMCYLHYAMDKMETMVFEDRHFQVRDTFAPHPAALLLDKAYRSTGNIVFHMRALAILNACNPPAYLEPATSIGLFGHFQRWRIHKSAGEIFKMGNESNTAVYYFDEAMNTLDKDLSNSSSDTTDPNYRIGMLASQGLALMAYLDAKAGQPLDLFPFHLRNS